MAGTPTSAVLEPICATCRFFRTQVDIAGQPCGTCQRYPPGPPLDDDGFSMFPVVVPEWWCGEYQPQT